MPNHACRFMHTVCTAQRDAPAITATQNVTRGATRAFDAAGAGLTLFGRLRVPLDADTDDVRYVEQLEVTLGEGPSLAAGNSGHPVVADEADLRARWPLYAIALSERTPFRSTVSLPIKAGAGAATIASLDIYYTEAQPESELAQEHAQQMISSTTLALLLHDPAEPLRPTSRPTDPRTRDRLAVWTAVGMIMGACAADETDSLARLRGYAFTHDYMLDVLAGALVTNQISLQDVLDED